MRLKVARIQGIELPANYEPESQPPFAIPTFHKRVSSLYFYVGDTEAIVLGSPTPLWQKVLYKVTPMSDKIKIRSRPTQKQITENENKNDWVTSCVESSRLVL